MKICGSSLLVLLTLAGSAGAQSEAESFTSPPTDSGPSHSKKEVPALGDQTPASPADGDILNMDLDQLTKVNVVVPSFDTTVTSVNKRESTVGKSPAAIFVITNDMIRRSGVTSVPEAMRMAPGVNVARLDNNKWAISIRGFQDQFANKLLVLVDGRSTYTPYFNGVYWETQDLILQDIDRIEVIRGPGAVVWGNNSVNGVINIITKTAANTQGALISSGGGNQDRSINAFRYGGEINEHTQYRIYGKQEERASQFKPGAPTADDALRMGRYGFRLDWDPHQADRVSVQGSIYEGLANQMGTITTPNFPFTQPYQRKNNLSGGFLSGIWNHTIDDDSSTSLQAYWDRTHRNDFSVDLLLDTFDVSFQHNLKLWDTHRLSWGVENRLTSDNIPSNAKFEVQFTPQHLTFDQPSAFLQDEMPVFRDDVTLTLGTRFLVNNFSGFGVQPSARALWAIDERRAVWGGISRALRTPSRNEATLLVGNFATNNSLPLFNLRGNNGLQAEQLMSHEFGYRQQITDQFSWDIAAFYNVYSGLISQSFVGFSPAFPPTIFAVYGNSASAQTRGFELSAKWEVNQKWRIQGWYSLLEMNVKQPLTSSPIRGASPNNQIWLMSSWDLPHAFEFDLIPRYVDNLPGVNPTPVAAYTTLDARLGWRPSKSWDFSVVGQNLLQPHHFEYNSSFTQSAISRAVYGQVTWMH